MATGHTTSAYPFDPKNQRPGLTKRELVAAMAMQGILASETPADDFEAKTVARRSKAFADALLVALTDEDRV